MQTPIHALLHSDWFIQMLEKSSPQPKQRLLNVFVLLEDWLSAPFQPLKNQANQANQANHNNPSQAPALQTYLMQQAKLAGSRSPEVLANQIYFMALSAANTYVLHPQSNSLKHAQQATKALIEAESSSIKGWTLSPVWQYGLMGLVSLTAITLGIAWLLHQSYTPAMVAQTSSAITMGPSSQMQEASPSETAAIYARLEMMRHGDCRFIEAIQLPEQVKSIYIENVIQGRISQNREQQRIVNELLDQVKCNYTPKLMLNSVS